MPLPPQHRPVAPGKIIEDIQDPQYWRAFESASGADSSIGALQAFYLREAPQHGWQIQEYAPYPSPSNLGFARLRLAKDNQTVILGLMPFSAENPSTILAKIVMKMMASA